MFWSHVLLRACLELVGVNVAIDTYADVPWKPDGQPWWDCDNGGCTETMMGGPVEYAPGQCFLPVSMADPYYDFLWCQDVAIVLDNGPVHVATPCTGDAGLLSNAETPYALRLYWAEKECPPIFAQLGFCTVDNVCTPADVIAEDCTCTAAEEPCPSPLP